MRKIILQMMVSADGYFEGPNGELDWHNVDEEFNEQAIDFLSKVDLLLFGRKTYELMESYWPTKDAEAEDPIIAHEMNSLPKIVFSKTLGSPNWNNTRLVRENVNEEIIRLKHLPGKDIAIFGSSDFAVSIMPLIDEYRIVVNPVILGCGKSLFHWLKERRCLKLIQTQVFKSGNVLLCYQPYDSE